MVVFAWFSLKISSQFTFSANVSICQPIFEENTTTSINELENLLQKLKRGLAIEKKLLDEDSQILAENGVDLI